MMDKVNVFMDMDGVLVQYDRAVYSDPSRPWEALGAHYFATLRPDQRALALARALDHEPWATVSVCSRTSSLTTSAVGREQFEDKRKWCRSILEPYVDIHHLIVTHWRKESAAEAALGRPLRTTDVLVDDFNENLTSWEAAGGRSVKWLNGENNADSWYGTSIDPTRMGADAMLTAILREAYRSNVKIIRRKDG